ncbi:hypothetical protein BGZ76_000114 [Entomortierella beljakovae]|nr:hypothetical protein BGZ76_000114 [Entomortierella beljakovae]
MSEQLTPHLANPSPEAVIASLSRSIEASSRALELDSVNNLPLNDNSLDTLISTDSNSQSELTSKDNLHGSTTSVQIDLSQEILMADQSLITPQSSQLQPSPESTNIVSTVVTPLAPIESDNTPVSIPNPTPIGASDDIVLDSDAVPKTDNTGLPGLADTTIHSSQSGEKSLLAGTLPKAIHDHPIEITGDAEQLHPRQGLAAPWKDLVTSMLSEESVSGSSGSSKRNNADPSDIDSEPHEFVKRRRVDNLSGSAPENSTRDEIENKMNKFIEAKREQINQSNRQEFVKDRHQVTATDTETSEPIEGDDDSCARVDTRKLNRTIQMKLETVKNDALIKTNPKNTTQNNDPHATNSGLDERLRNIQLHLNLRIAATPACSIAERVRIVEDVIIQLERDYPLWSALHFNQPNRVFPPPPSVTTVSRNSKNQILITGDHLQTTLLDHGDVFANPASLTKYPGIGVSPSVNGAQSEVLQHQNERDVISGLGSTITSPINGGKNANLAGPSKIAAGNSTGAGGSATVIRLKRHGGAGSSSLARSVQQQLAQRKANAAAAAAAAGQTIEEFRASFSSENNASSSSFKVSQSSPLDSGLSITSSSSFTSADFPTSLKPGVTGRGPIKSRRKSIAKALDPASTASSLAAAQGSGIHNTNMGSTLIGDSSGIPANDAMNARPSISEGSLGSLAGSKQKLAAPKKARKKKGEGNADEGTSSARTGAGKGKGGFGLGKGKGGGRPLALGLGKGKGGAYREEMLRRAEMEDSDDESDEDGEDDIGFRSSVPNNVASAISGSSNPLLFPSDTTFSGDKSALAHLVDSALKDQAARAHQGQQQLHRLSQESQQQQPKSKKQPRKQSTPTKPPPVRKFGGKSFGMAGGESSGSSSNESSDGEETGSSGSQSDSSSSNDSISGSELGESD